VSPRRRSVSSRRRSVSPRRRSVSRSWRAAPVGRRSSGSPSHWSPRPSHHRRGSTTWASHRPSAHHWPSTWASHRPSTWAHHRGTTATSGPPAAHEHGRRQPARGSVEGGLSFRAEHQVVRLDVGLVFVAAVVFSTHGSRVVREEAIAIVTVVAVPPVLGRFFSTTRHRDVR